MSYIEHYLSPFVISGTASISDTIEVAEIGGVVHQTTLKLVNTPITLTDDGSYMWGGVQLGTLTQGRILIHGVVVKDAYLEVLDSTMAADDGGDFAMGTTSEEDGTLDRASDINLCPSTSLDPIGTAVDSALAASCQIDATAAAMPVFWNMQIDTADGSDLAEVLGVNATITITWTNLGND